MVEIPDRLADALADRYKLEGRLGEGGMATVYLADDLKHDRKVAVKVLRPELSAILGGERFLHEIKVTANLQHPNILPLYDSGEADTFLYYVMPYLEGESLRDKLEREQQLGVEEAVKVAESVAAALDYAHQHDVVHRDIKPENILIQSGQALVADFGIALAVSQAGGTRLTETGLSLGTPHYMSPEQATGDRSVDARSDIYSLGCVTYEMLVGEPPHVGKSVQAIVAKILSDTPAPITRSRELVPPNIDAAVQKALARSPADRFTTAAEFATALTDSGFTLPTTQVTAAATGLVTRSWNRLSVGLAGAAAVLALLLVWVLARPAASAPVIRYSMAMPAEERVAGVFGPSLAISPDGSKIVYAGPSLGSGNQLWLRERNALNATELPGTDGGYQPFFSPDGQRVGFLIIARARELNVISLTGEPPITLVGDSVFRLGGTWGPDGFVYYSKQPDGGLARVPATGGPSEVISAPDSASGVRRHAWPHALPSGKGVIVTLEKGLNLIDEQDDVGVVNLETGEARVLLRGVWGRYASTGHLLFVRFDGALMAAPFDQNSMELTGPAVPMLGGVAVRRGPDIALSEAGTLMYATGQPAGQLVAEVVWYDRQGGVTPIEPGWTVTPNPNSGPRLSPDGRNISMSLDGDEGTHIWIKQIGGPLRRLTFEGGNFRPQWAPDGESVLYSSTRGGQLESYRRDAGGSGRAELLVEWDSGVWSQTMSPDGKWLVFRTAPNIDVFAMQLGVDSVPQPLFVGSQTNEGGATLSPDGRWMAYISNESGMFEVYVRPFPNTADGKWQVSSGGAIEPVWSRRGDELFFRALGVPDQLAVVRVTTEPTFTASQPTVLFAWPEGIGRQYQPTYDVSLDGERFLMYRPSGPINAATEELIVVENFLQELKEKVGKE